MSRIDLELRIRLSGLEDALTIGNGEPGVKWLREEAARVVERFRQICPLPAVGEPSPEATPDASIGSITIEKELRCPKCGVVYGGHSENSGWISSHTCAADTDDRGEKNAKG